MENRVENINNVDNLYHGDVSVVIDTVNVFEIDKPVGVKSYEDHKMQEQTFRFVSKKMLHVLLGMIFFTLALAAYEILNSGPLFLHTMYSTFGIAVIWLYAFFVGSILFAFKFTPWWTHRSKVRVVPHKGCLHIEGKEISFSEVRRVELVPIEGVENFIRIYTWTEVQPIRLPLPNEHDAKYLFDAIKYGVKC